MYNILAVDDDRTCLLILKEWLEKWGYQVTTVENAHEALSMLENKSFDLVITDIHMPEMNGFELQERINQNFNLPIILISADTRAEVMCIGIKNGAERFFVKPLVANNFKDIWQFVEWWKRTRSNNTTPLTQINGSSEESRTAVIDSHRDNDNNTLSGNTTGRGRKRLVWTSDLHTRFVEAILVIGYHKGSSRRAIYATLMQELDSSTNVASTGLGSVNSHKAHTQNMGSIIGSSTSNFIHNLSYSTNHMDYYHQNPLAQEHENYSNSANTNMPLGGNHFTPPSKVHLENNFQSYQLVDVGEEDNNNFSHENNFHHDQLSQLENKHGDPSMGISSGGNHFENTSAMDALELDGKIMTDESWFNNIGGEGDNDYWLNIEFDEDVDKDQNRGDI
ncbi:two-component response regulator ARR12 [Daucus carota subsp. sativus]|uniref:two-component response regulator ARR12 n=1 Tax=Daucus carota subsp. sativus TaxID=79200 RepID=UPI0007F03115|nr:PREDICTED: two-component response regulator ARR12-like [Daucus carota subsp. sativus]